MKIPKKVKIGGVTYNIILANEWDNDDGADGETFITQRNGNTIYIREELTQEAKEITLIHEAMHCMNTTMNHEFLDSLAEQLYQFLKDNDLIR